MANNEDENLSIAERIHRALSESLHPKNDAIVTRWVLAVERIHMDGERMTGIFAHEGMEPWEVIGLAEMASEVARVQIGTDVVEEIYSLDDDEDDD